MCITFRGGRGFDAALEAAEVYAKGLTPVNRIAAEQQVIFALNFAYALSEQHLGRRCLSNCCFRDDLGQHQTHLQNVNGVFTST